MTAAPAPLEATFANITVRLLDHEHVQVTRRGSPGRGPSRIASYWMLDQIEAAALNAEARRDPEAKAEASALRWAIARITE
ncbi:hypothetical protein PANO111632_02720 [Paracoccus nototheniae]|uniref:Uncharacterized protein n=1 Tax=Paracoccus nototheniae TaxID=2489002 RepID=A0ABW4DV78_9RHOB|nr:hypothetical protein [Paracoccus nototheniae]